ncbi:TPA: hypothetical protein NHV44_000402 [Enterobacter cloacae]|uniref:hypothetical protein n=1 Tax=Enterobacter cloacae TaxID=550 RepID=UPI002147228D|nr:hypothetical protein [Enterobacter cloacae]HBM7655339.1 hypothetical protein [Enterobacter cloacae subsp. cloacae]HCE8675638.1 hypothetical protein [Enterobacter cloacae]HCE9221406.1 hypothetical protein [Enterobacter cloacae]
MKLFEMEGFLRGKCLPGDMKVNETHAEYLVRKFTELEQKLAESQREFRAADATIENLQMKLNAEREAKLALAAENARLKDLARSWANATDDRLFEEHGEIFHDSIDACEEELKTICPATDAFLAEVRAQGVEMFAKEMHADISGDDAREFAAQLRKGGATEEKQSFLSDEDCHAFVKAFTKGAAQ